ncbi:MAG: hypothetical protein WBF90_12600 [Rivularia sp. (in: cyanobacteria)]
MKVKLIVYKRIKNLGNYETEHLEMSAELAENEDVEQASRQLRRLVNNLLQEPVWPIEDDDMGDF